MAYLMTKTGANKKRKVVTTVEEVASAELEEGWLAELLELKKDDLAKLLGDIANQGVRGKLWPP